MKPRTVYAADLFSGCGGLTLGLSNAGVSVRVGVDTDKRVSETYKSNNPKSHLILDDIRNVDGEDILRRIPRGQLHILAGCAPCQGFSSLTNKHRRDDPRNDLVLEMARLVAETDPQIVVMENVPGLVRRGRKLFDEFLWRLKKAGYYPNWDILQMADFGVPQNRRRLVFTAGKGFVVPLPEPTHHKRPNETQQAWLNLREAIGHYTAPPTLGNSKKHGGPRSLNWHVIRDLEPQTKARLKAAIPGKTWLSYDESIRPKCHQGTYNGFTNVYQRMTWDQLPVTMTAGCTVPAKGRFGHPDRRRSTISVREAATLQTFPEDYVFESDYIDHVCDMIGNAVPPVFAEELGRCVSKSLRDHMASIG